MCLPWPVSKILLKTFLTFFVFVFLSLYPQKIKAASFNIAPQDTSALINAINEATSSGEPAVINLATNSKYLLTERFNSSYSYNGLPLITSEITINGNGSLINRDNTALRFRILALDSSGKLTINQLTINNGFSTDDFFGGGAILNLGGILIVNDLTISNNFSLIGGGAGIWDMNGTSTINNTKIIGNNAGNSGETIAAGGAFMKRGSGIFQVSNSVLSNNIAKTIGGAIYSNQTGDIVIESSEISNNSTENEGGAIFNYKGNISIHNSNFSNNKATRIDAYGIGGGILNNYENSEVVGSITITNSHFTNNTATNNGGFLYNRGPASLHNSCISGNSDVALFNSGPQIDATQNYWGTPDGPNKPGADTIYGNVDYDPWLTSCPPVASPNPSPEPSPVPSPVPSPIPTPNPIVLLPGLGGSWNTLALITESSGDNWKKTPFVKVYDNLKNTFLNGGYTEGDDYFEFYYDWRKRVDNLADDLKNYLEAVVLPHQPPNTKVDLVGHSLGGLVARAYTQKYGTDKIDDLVTTGSPHEGVIPAYLAWWGAETDGVWQSLGISFYLHLHQGRFTSPITAIQNLSPSLQDLLPIFDFAKNESGAVIPVNSMASVNTYLNDLKNSLNQSLTDLMATIAGKDQQTVEWINLGDRTLTDRLLGRWPDGRPMKFDYTDKGDLTVLEKSALIADTDQTTVSNAHVDLVQTPSGIGAILNALNLDFEPQTGNEQPDLTPGLFFLLHSPAELTVTIPGGGQAGFGVTDPIANSFYSPEDKLLLIWAAPSGDYQTTISGTGNGQYQLDIGQLTDSGNSWWSLIDEIQTGQEDNWTVQFSPDQPLDNPVINDNIGQARLRLERLKTQTTERRLIRYLDLIIKLLDKNHLSRLRLALTSTYKFRFWVDRFAQSDASLKSEADAIGQLLNRELVNQGQNSRDKITQKRVRAELQAASLVKKHLEKRAEKLSGENQVLGNTLELTNRYFNRAQDSFEDGNYWQTHADALVVRVLIIEANALIR